MSVLSLKHISHLQVFGSLIWKRHSHLQYEWISSVPCIPTLDPSIMVLLLFHWYTCMHFYSPGKYQAWFCYYDSMLLLSPKLSFVFYIIQELNTNGYNIRNKEQNSGYIFFLPWTPWSVFLALSLWFIWVHFEGICQGYV